MAIQQPASPPNISDLPEAPNSASDTPSEFDTKANTYVAAQVGLPPEINASNAWVKSTADITYNNALDAEQSATEAQAAASDALAAGNLLGKWVDKTGSASIGDSVEHDSGIWRLLVNLSDITVSEPSLANSDWLLTFKRASDADIEVGTQYTNPDAEQVKNKLVQREWESLTNGKKYNESCFYRGKQYVARNPIADDQIDVAPPPSTGRSYFEYASSDTVTIGVSLIAGQQIKANYLAPHKAITKDVITGILSLSSGGTYVVSAGFTVFIDGEQISSSTPYNKDGLSREISITLSAGFSLSTVSLLSDLEIFNSSGERIHYFPLRNDAVDYLAGNLVKDEEFTWKVNWDASDPSITINNNSINFNNSPASETVRTVNPTRTETGTYRYIYDYDVTSGTVRAVTFGSGIGWDTEHTGNGTVDSVVVGMNVSSDGDGFTCGAGTTATIKNFRVIKLNELSPSADFSSDAGFTLSGGVTIDTINKQAVFGSGGGTKAFRSSNVLQAGTKVRISSRFNGRTTASFQVYSLADAAAEYLTAVNSDSSGDVEVLEYTLLNDSNGIGVITLNGWDGNVEYFSVTEVTDGTENGSIEKSFDRYWQLTNGEQSIEKAAGVIGFNDVPLALTGSTYKIAPLSTANLRDEIKLSRSGINEPVIELDDADIAAGLRITHPNSTPDTSVTINTNDKITLIYNGQDLELVRG